MNRLLRPFHSSQAPKISFAFDIDGVLVQGRNALSAGQNALKLLEKFQIPFIVLTNGGGMLEKEKAIGLGKRMGIEIPHTRVCLSHTPMKSLKQKYKNEHVLVIGGGDHGKMKEVAHSYGFQKVITSREVFETYHDVWPFKRSKPKERRLDEISRLKISACLVMHDSFDWGMDMQIMYDVLRSKGGHYMSFEKGSKQAVPLYFSNSDMVWRADYPHLRFAQGSFKHSFSALYRELSGHDLEYTAFGKPSKQTYQYADSMLRSISTFDKVYMIGDNPKSDILGANNYGWESMLVTTGVWQGEPGHGAKHIANDAEEAVVNALRANGYKV